jgi:hypothetical protein
MIRTVIFASLLAFAGGCIDQGQPDVGTTDQDLTAVAPCTVVGGPCLTNIVPIPWNDRTYSSVWDYWAPPPAPTTTSTTSVVVPNLQMVAFVVNGAPAVLDPVSGATTVPATRMVWLISNRGVFRVYQVNVDDVAEMEQFARNSFTIVENYYEAVGYSSPGSTIIVGVGGGAVVPKGGGTPHGEPLTVVNAMVGYALTARSLIVNVQDVGRNSQN